VERTFADCQVVRNDSCSATSIGVDRLRDSGLELVSVEEIRS
jgi:hypothetical protein